MGDNNGAGLWRAGANGMVIHPEALRGVFNGAIMQYEAYKLEHLQAIAAKEAQVKQLRREIEEHRKTLHGADGAVQAVTKLREVTDKAQVQARLDGAVKAVEMQAAESKKPPAATPERPSLLALGAGTSLAKDIEAGRQAVAVDATANAVKGA